MLILFATTTGNAESLAAKIAKDLKRSGQAAEVVNIAVRNPSDLAREHRPVLICASTWGEGEPPDEALRFWEDLQDLPAGSLANLHYAVYAIGDSSYDEFCGFGRKLDEALEARGAKRITRRQDADLDYEEFVGEWLTGVRQGLVEHGLV